MMVRKRGTVPTGFGQEAVAMQGGMMVRKRGTVPTGFRHWMGVAARRRRRMAHGRLAA
ncbi:MAG: hypothetical protein IJG84_12800 [Kiritimatiellae bacterium]|nr:hypothetical protein [Kiritimatiellia bacterium]